MKKKHTRSLIFALLLVIAAVVAAVGLTERKPAVQKVEKKIEYEIK